VICPSCFERFEPEEDHLWLRYGQWLCSPECGAVLLRSVENERQTGGSGPLL